MLAKSYLALGIIVALFTPEVSFPEGGIAGEAAHPFPPTFQDCAISCPQMVTIDRGTFVMGATAEEMAPRNALPPENVIGVPRHSVTIDYEFAIGKYDVTRGEFAAFVSETGYFAANDCLDYFTGMPPKSGQTPLNWRNPGFPQTDRDPVVCVNWDDVHAYLAWLTKKTLKTYRLPSEAEWE